MPHLTITRDLLWSVRSRTSAITRDLIWNTRSRTSPVTRNLLWNTRARVTSTRQLIYNVSAKLTATRQLLWSVNANTGEGTSAVQECRPYPFTSPVFARVYVDHLVKGNSKVYWELSRRFHEAGPYVFQLQTSDDAISDPLSWVDVGEPVIDSFYALDNTQRLYGKQLQTHYRIKLTVDSGTYYSQPVSVQGKLNKRDWGLAREITRKELLRASRYTAIDGYLLIARRSGTICECVDTITGESRIPNCPDCYGVTYEGGYYAPVSCTFFDMTSEKRKEYREMQARGLTDDIIKIARFIGFPMLQSRDVFVDKDSDERFYIDEISEPAEVRGIPIVVTPVIRLAPFSDIIYTFPVERDQ